VPPVASAIALTDHPRAGPVTTALGQPSFDHILHSGSRSGRKARPSLASCRQPSRPRRPGSARTASAGTGPPSRRPARLAGAVNCSRRLDDGVLEPESFAASKSMWARPKGQEEAPRPRPHDSTVSPPGPSLPAQSGKKKEPGGPADPLGVGAPNHCPGSWTCAGPWAAEGGHHRPAAFFSGPRSIPASVSS